VAPAVGRQIPAAAPDERRGTGSAPSRVRVAYQGEPGAYSEAAALGHFGDVRPRGYPTFRDVAERVASGEAERGVLPIENSLAGSILQVYDLLQEFESLHIVGEIRLRVSHHLIGHPGAKLQEVRRVLAHFQAAAQCRRLLEAHPEWTVEPSYDTAGSVKLAKERGRRDEAAIASARAAEVYGMAVLAEAVEDDPQNYTRFVVVSREPRADGRGTKTSLLYTTRNEPGALCATLQVFSKRGLNLARIESRPIAGRPWEYRFYVDVEGRVGSVRLDSALAELRGLVEQLRLLGCYPGA
jgi:prephenate dehydratase